MHNRELTRISLNFLSVCSVGLYYHTRQFVEKLAEADIEYAHHVVRWTHHGTIITQFGHHDAHRLTVDFVWRRHMEASPATNVTKCRT